MEEFYNLNMTFFRLVSYAICRLLHSVGATLNQRQMRFWHLAGRDFRVFRVLRDSDNKIRITEGTDYAERRDIWQQRHIL